MHLADKLGVLELNKAVSDAFTGGQSAVLRACTVSLFLGVVFSDGVYTDFAAHVELVGHGGSADVEPVLVNWRQVLVARGFIVGCPLIKI